MAQVFSYGHLGDFEDLGAQARLKKLYILHGFGKSLRTTVTDFRFISEIM